MTVWNSLADMYYKKGDTKLSDLMGIKDNDNSLDDTEDKYEKSPIKYDTNNNMFVDAEESPYEKSGALKKVEEEDQSIYRTSKFQQYNALKTSSIEEYEEKKEIVGREKEEHSPETQALLDRLYRTLPQAEAEQFAYLSRAADSSITELTEGMSEEMRANMVEGSAGKDMIRRISSLRHGDPERFYSFFPDGFKEKLESGEGMTNEDYGRVAAMLAEFEMREAEQRAAGTYLTTEMVKRNRDEAVDTLRGYQAIFRRSEDKSWWGSPDKIDLVRRVVRGEENDVDGNPPKVKSFAVVLPVEVARWTAELFRHMWSRDGSPEVGDPAARPGPGSGLVGREEAVGDVFRMLQREAALGNMPVNIVSVFDDFLVDVNTEIQTGSFEIGDAEQVNRNVLAMIIKKYEEFHKTKAKKVFSSEEIRMLNRELPWAKDNEIRKGYPPHLEPVNGAMNVWGDEKRIGGKKNRILMMDAKRIAARAFKTTTPVEYTYYDGDSGAKMERDGKTNINDTLRYFAGSGRRETLKENLEFVLEKKEPESLSDLALTEYRMNTGVAVLGLLEITSGVLEITEGESYSEFYGGPSFTEIEDLNETLGALKKAGFISTTTDKKKIMEELQRGMKQSVEVLENLAEYASTYNDPLQKYERRIVNFMNEWLPDKDYKNMSDVLDDIDKASRFSEEDSMQERISKNDTLFTFNQIVKNSGDILVNEKDYDDLTVRLMKMNDAKKASLEGRAMPQNSADTAAWGFWAGSQGSVISKGILSRDARVMNAMGSAMGKLPTEANPEGEGVFGDIVKAYKELSGIDLPETSYPALLSILRIDQKREIPGWIVDFEPSEGEIKDPILMQAVATSLVRLLERQPITSETVPEPLQVIGRAFKKGIVVMNDGVDQLVKDPVKFQQAIWSMSLIPTIRSLGAEEETRMLGALGVSSGEFKALETLAIALLGSASEVSNVGEIYAMASEEGDMTELRARFMSSARNSADVIAASVSKIYAGGDDFKINSGLRESLNSLASLSAAAYSAVERTELTKDKPTGSSDKSEKMYSERVRGLRERGIYIPPDEAARTELRTLIEQGLVHFDEQMTTDLVDNHPQFGLVVALGAYMGPLRRREHAATYISAVEQTGRQVPVSGIISFMSLIAESPGTRFYTSEGVVESNSSVDAPSLKKAITYMNEDADRSTDISKTLVSVWDTRMDDGNRTMSTAQVKDMIDQPETRDMLMRNFTFDEDMTSFQREYWTSKIGAIPEIQNEEEWNSLMEELITESLVSYRSAFSAYNRKNQAPPWARSIGNLDLHLDVIRRLLERYPDNGLLPGFDASLFSGSRVYLSGGSFIRRRDGTEDSHIYNYAYDSNETRVVLGQEAAAESNNLLTGNKEPTKFQLGIEGTVVAFPWTIQEKDFTRTELDSLEFVDQVLEESTLLRTQKNMAKPFVKAIDGAIDYITGN